MTKLNKTKMSNEINEMFGLKDGDCINWARLDKDNLTSFYIMMVSPEQLMKIAQNIGAKMIPGMKGEMGDMAKDLMGGMMETVSKEGGNALISNATDMLANSPMLADRPIARAMLQRAMERVNKKKQEAK